MSLAKCRIPMVWCGESNKPPKISKDGYNYYSGLGTRSQCLKQGFGAATFSKNVGNPGSIRNIKYIGEQHEKNFKKFKIVTTAQLVARCKNKTPINISKLLQKILVKSNNTLDARAYNSVAIYLYHNKINITTTCKKIK